MGPKRAAAGTLERRIAWQIDSLVKSGDLVVGRRAGSDVDSALQGLFRLDMSLRRRPENTLRRIVGDVLAARAAVGGAGTPDGPIDVDGDSARDEDELPEDVDSEVRMMTVKDTNFLNRSIASIYAKTTPPSDPAVRVADGFWWATSGKPSSSPPSLNPQPPQPTDSNTNSADSPIPHHESDPSLSSSALPAVSAVSVPTGTSERPPERRAKERRATSGHGDAPPTKKQKTDATAPTTLGPSSDWRSPQTRLHDVGGIEHLLDDLVHLVLLPFRHGELHAHLGIKPPRGVLLHGPSGCGKTLLAHAIAGELKVPMLHLSCPSIISSLSGDSEKRLREVFAESRQAAPCVVFLDEIDVIGSKREQASREMERRVVAQLLTCLDDLSSDPSTKPVIVIGATNRPDSLDPSLRRAGRFDREITIGVPDDAAREKILTVVCSKLRLTGDIDFVQLAKLTPGFVGADLGALAAEAGLIAVRRIFDEMLDGGEAPFAARGGDDMDEDTTPPTSAHDGPVTVLERFLRSRMTPLSSDELEPLAITSADFVAALKKVQPSSKREGFATVPDVTWDDIGALTSVREELRMAVVEPIRHPEIFRLVGIDSPMGVLLYGPPGCGKTLLAKAVANESHSNFISVKGPELLNKYVGESERAIRSVFARARASSPCVVFFDELDALAATRSSEGENQSGARLVNTLLTELDGLESRRSVFVIGATNRPDMIDPALIRPGRLDRLLYVDLPTREERLEILRTVSRKTPLAGDVNLADVASDKRCEGFSGADLSALLREAAMSALRGAYFCGGFYIESSANGADHGAQASHRAPLVTRANFDDAFLKVHPSVSKRDYKSYQAMGKRLSGIRSRLAPPESLAVGEGTADGGEGVKV